MRKLINFPKKKLIFISFCNVMKLNRCIQSLMIFSFYQKHASYMIKQNYTICQCPTQCTEFGCTAKTFNVAMMHENKCTCKYIQRICYSQAFEVDCTWTMKYKQNLPPLPPDRPWMEESTQPIFLSAKIYLHAKPQTIKFFKWLRQNRHLKLLKCLPFNYDVHI